MIALKRLTLIIGSVLLLLCGSASATANVNATLQGVQLAHDTGYPHYHGEGNNNGGGRIRSYEYCSKNVFEPCMQSGGTYRYCNRQHHLCTYGHLRNCIRGKTC